MAASRPALINCAMAIGDSQTPPDTRAPRMGAPEWLALFALSGLWGGSFFFFKVLVAELPPFTVVLGRVGIAALALNLLLWARRDPLRFPARQWGQFLVLGLINNVIPFSLIAFGETRIASGEAAILNATTPIFTILVAHFATPDEKLTPARSLGVLFGFLGAAVLIGVEALSRFGQGDLVGDGACLLAAAVYGLGAIYGRRFKGVPPLKIATGQVTASTMILVPLARLVDRPWMLPMPTAGAWMALFALALLCTALAYLLYFRILAVAGATNLVLVTFLLPGSALVLGAVFLGETVTATALAGMALIGLGLAAIDGRPLGAVRRLLDGSKHPPQNGNSGVGTKA
jgi:drug/metabolite transporter (DMT)-like permease